MFNTSLFLLTVVLMMGALVLSFRLFGKNGIIGVMCGSIVMANILTVKAVIILGLGSATGGVLYGLMFLATDLLSEHYGGKVARRAVWIGFIVSFMVTVGSWIAISMIPAEWDWADVHLKAIFTPMVRIVIGSLIAYLVSNTLDTYLYDWWRKKFPKYVWLRNNGSTWISQLVDVVLFVAIAFIGIFPLEGLVLMASGGYVLKIIVAGLDTPFLYWSKRIVAKHPELLD